jgi:hypothetical protein
MATEQEWIRGAQEAKKLSERLRTEAHKMLEQAAEQDIKALTCEKNAAEAKLHKYQQELRTERESGRFVVKTAPVLSDRQKKELTYLRKPDIWSSYPLVAMKKSRAGEWPEKATLCAWDPKSVPSNYALYRDLLPDLLKLYRAEKMNEATRSRIFNSLEEMLSEGWEVDGADALVIQRGA